MSPATQQAQDRAAREAAMAQNGFLRSYVGRKPVVHFVPVGGPAFSLAACHKRPNLTGEDDRR